MSTVPAIYAVRMNPRTMRQDYERIARWASLVPADRALRISRFHHWQDQWRSLAGDMLVRYVLRVKYGVTGPNLQFSKNAHHKPFLRGNEVQFNVSHSGAWTVAAFHTEAIGIDIERIGKADMELARAMFAASEYEALSKQCPDRRDHLFYAIWTAKESCLKAVGKGLSIPLDSFSVVDDGDESAMASEGEMAVGETGSAASTPGLKSFIEGSAIQPRGWHLRQFDLDPEYMLTACSITDWWPNRLSVVDAAKLD